MLKSRILFFILLTALGIAAVILLDFFDAGFSFHDILVESHGLIFDLIIFGVLITIYDRIRSKDEKIERYREELEDYRFWFGEESKYRTKGIINRLFKMGVEKIDLSYCHVFGLNPPKKMIKWKLLGATVEHCFFMSVNLTGTKFDNSSFLRTLFSNSNLKNCDFGFCVLGGTRFSHCTFDNTNLDNAYVSDMNWIDQLLENKNVGVEKVKAEYLMSKNAVCIEGEDYYQIIRVDANRDFALTPVDLISKASDYLMRPVLNI